MNKIIHNREPSSKYDYFVITGIFALSLLTIIISDAVSCKHNNTLDVILVAILIFTTLSIAYFIIPDSKKEIIIDKELMIISFKNVWLRTGFWSLPKFSNYKYKFDDILNIYKFGGWLVVDYYIVTTDGTIYLSGNVVSDEVEIILLDITKNKPSVPMRRNPYVYLGILMIILILFFEIMKIYFIG
jgi:hypothetical protein